VDETAAGQTFACPACQGSVVVPASQPTRTSGPPPSYGRSTAALFSWPILCCSATAFLQRKISSTTAPKRQRWKCASPAQW